MKELNAQQLHSISGGESFWGSLVNWFTGNDGTIQTTGKNPFGESGGGTSPIVRYTQHID